MANENLIAAARAYARHVRRKPPTGLMSGDAREHTHARAREWEIQRDLLLSSLGDAALGIDAEGYGG